MTAEEYQKLIAKISAVEKKYSIPSNILVGLLAHESANFDDDVLSGKKKSGAGAVGIGQFMNRTAKEYKIDPTNIDQSIDAAGKYLQGSFKQFGNTDDAILSYNAGVAGVKAYKAGKPMTSKEHREYVGKVKSQIVKFGGVFPTPKVGVIAETEIPQKNYEQQTQYLPISERQDVAKLETGDAVDLEADTQKLQKEYSEKEKLFLNDYSNLLASEEQATEIPQEEIQQAPIANYLDIYNQVSDFVDSPLAQEGGKYTQNEIDFLSEISIKDNKGQYNHPGKITQISSPNITMKNVKQALRGISLETGEEKMMYPNRDYFFENTKNVLEIPMAQQGGKSITNNSEQYIYNIQKGDTLSKIANIKNIPLNTLANANQISNPDLIIEGKTLNIPTKFNRELSFQEIPTTDNKKIVIDNYSKHYDYIVEGDKTYYKTKGGKTWADISDNTGARKNLIKFIGDNDYWAGYGSGENKTTTQPSIEKLNTNKKNGWGIKTSFPNIDFLPKIADKQKIQAKENGLDNTVTYIKDYIKPPQQNKIYKKEPLSVFDVISDSFNVVLSEIEDLGEITKNGIKRVFDKNINKTNSDKEIKNSVIPLTPTAYYKNAINQKTIDIDGNRQYKQQVLPINQATWGYRNRGNNKEIKTDGIEITSFSPYESNNHKGESVIVLDTVTGKVGFDSYDNIKDLKNKVFSKTYMNKVVDFETDSKGGLKLKSGEVSGNSSYKQPVIKVIDDKGVLKEGSLNILLKDQKSKEKYGSLQGGRVVFKNPTTKESFLISGSTNHIQQEFKKLKGDAPYLEMYTLDNGTYARGLSTKSKILKSKDLNSYDNENTSGGNGLYIKNYNTTPYKYKQDIVENMPNIRNKEDVSYKKGHALKNEQLNIVLHHTAYTNDKTNGGEVRKQYMKKGNTSSHVVIEEDGTRTVYASPEQVTFHAGESTWKGRGNVNDFGIGVEFQGDTNEKPLTEAQIESFVEYYKTINKKNNIPLSSIITHQMITPLNSTPETRKPDITKKEYQKIIKRLSMQQGGQYTNNELAFLKELKLQPI